VANNTFQPVANAVNVVYPSIYTFYTDQEGWKKYAIAQVAEARRLAPGKPVYAFIWPRYHESNKALNNQYIAADFWRFQLETLYQVADGVVIWGGWQEPWNERADWWIQTQAFMQSHER